MFFNYLNELRVADIPPLQGVSLKAEWNIMKSWPSWRSKIGIGNIVEVREISNLDKNLGGAF